MTAWFSSWPGNRASLFFQPQFPHGTYDVKSLSVTILLKSANSSISNWATEQTQYPMTVSRCSIRCFKLALSAFKSDACCLLRAASSLTSASKHCRFSCTAARRPVRCSRSSRLLLTKSQYNITIPYLTVRGRSFTPSAEASNGPNAHPRINHEVTKSPGEVPSWVHTNGTIPPLPRENTHLGPVHPLLHAQYDNITGNKFTGKTQMVMYNKVKVKLTMLHYDSIGRCSSPSSRPWARRWRTTNVSQRINHMLRCGRNV